MIGWFAILPLAFASFPEVSPPQVANDNQLTSELRQLLERLHAGSQIRQQHVAVSLVDLTDAASPRYAGINDEVMMYAASVPKIAILLAGFEEIRAGRLQYTPAVRDTFTRMVRLLFQCGRFEGQRNGLASTGSLRH